MCNAYPSQLIAVAKIFGRDPSYYSEAVPGIEGTPACIASIFGDKADVCVSFGF